MTDTNQDEEVSIDLSKIKSFFKKKTEEKKQGTTSDSILPEKEKTKEEPKSQDSDEEISIDLSKFKNFFKKKLDTEKSEEEKKPDEQDSDEIEIDFSKVKDLFKSKSSDTETKSKKKEEPETSIVKEILSAKAEENPSEEKVDVSALKKAFDLKKLSRILPKDEETEKFVEKKEKQKEDSKEKEPEENVLPEAKKILGNIWKKRGYVVPIVLLLFVIYIATFIRMANNNVPLTEAWADNAYQNYHLNRIRAEINQQYPNLPDTNRETIVTQRMNKFFSENPEQIKQDKKQIANTFRETFLDEKGMMYMPDIDTYYWLRYTKTVLDHGFLGDEIREGVPYDNLMLAPFGYPIEKQDFFHPYFLAYLYKTMSIFNSDITLMRSMMYYPLIIVALSLIPTFFIGRKIGGDIAGVAASLLLAINTMFVSKTLFGHADSDAWVVFFPLYATWFLLEALTTKKAVWTIILSSISGLLVGLFVYVWGGWWYIFDFLVFAMIGTIVASVLIHLIKNKSLKGYTKQDYTKSIFIGLIFFIIGAGLISSTAIGFKEFIKTPINPLIFSEFKEPVASNLWPNVYVTVAELKEGNLPEIIGLLGGKPYFFIGLLGLILLLGRNLDNKNGIFIAVSAIWYLLMQFDFFIALPIITYLILLGIPLGVWILFFSDTKKIFELKLSMLLLLWIVSGIYASTKGIRFALIIAPAFAIAFGIAVSWFVEFFSKMLYKELNLSKIISTGVLIIVVAVLYIKPIQASYAAAYSDMPIINDAWYNSLTKIKLNSSTDAIITSWWDFGHHFKALAERRVTFDGSTQSTGQAHWVGRMLLTDEENLSVGILRMLNCGGTTGYEFLNKEINDAAKSVDILHNILEMKNEDVVSYLKKNKVSEDTITKVINSTHCNPVENFLITSEDMVSKAPVWGHFGAWDFDKALAHSRLKSGESTDIDSGIKFLQERFGYSAEEAEKIYFEILNMKPEDSGNWISPWPVFVQPVVGCSELPSGLLRCENFFVNISSHDVWLTNPTGTLRPKIAVFPNENGYFVREYNSSYATLQNTGRPVGVTFIPGESYSMIISDYQLSNSLFTKLFYLNGHGLKHFKEFSDQRTLLGNKILVWDIDWGSNVTNIVEWKKNGTE